MRTSASSLVLALLVSIAACKKDPATTACLSDEGTIQDCGIACTISKSKEACAKWETMTVELCDKAGKDACEELCEADDNQHACAKAKTM